MPSRGRSSSNHSKPGVFSTAPARPAEALLEAGLLLRRDRDGVDLHDTHAAPLPGTGGAQSRHAARWRREHAPHRRPRLRPARPRPRRRTGTPEVVYAAGKTPEQTVACLEALRDGGSALAWATRVDDATAAAVLERWPDAVVDAEARCVVRRRAARSRVGAGAGAHRRHVRRRRRRRGRRDPGRAAGSAAARVDDVGRGRRAPGARRRARASPTPTPSSSSPAWTARCRASSPG